MIYLRDKRIGLVLSGGGAKGAYQVGMFKAIEELGISPQIKAMSGCSIGAYAAVIYALLGNDAYRDFLYTFPDMLTEGESLPESVAEEARLLVERGQVSLDDFISQRKFWIHEALGLHRYFDELLSGNAIEHCGVRLNVCAYSLEKKRPIYFPLETLSREEQCRAIIGSGSLEFLFKPSEVRGDHYMDGGIIPSICINGAPADKIPLPPMVNEDVEVIITNFLIAADSVDRSLVPARMDYLELRPSIPMEAFPGAGTLDFSPEKLKSHENMGYKDTLQLLSTNCIF